MSYTFLPFDDVQEWRDSNERFHRAVRISSGNVVNVVTKSGSNQFLGDAYEFYRNSAADARYYFNSSAQPNFDRNQFGGTIGGADSQEQDILLRILRGIATCRRRRLTSAPCRRRRGANWRLLGVAGRADRSGGRGARAPDSFTARSTIRFRRGRSLRGVKVEINDTLA